VADAGLTLIVGGARSGKSAHGEALVSALPAPWIYVATAEAGDAEMATRIEEHRRRRNGRWQTLEAPTALAETLADVPAGTPVLVDCLTLWLSNLMLAASDTDAAAAALLDVLDRPRGPWFLVSNEIGLGIVPENALARRFRDEAGMLNRRVAAIADRVLFMVAGIAMQVK